MTMLRIVGATQPNCEGKGNTDEQVRKCTHTYVCPDAVRKHVCESAGSEPTTGNVRLMVVIVCTAQARILMSITEELCVC